MATTRNPFFSLAASGTAGGITVQEKKIHRAHVTAALGPGATIAQIHRYHQHIAKAAQKPRKRTPTAAQLAKRAAMRDCAAAWRGIDATNKNAWKTRRLACYKPSTVGLAFTFYHGYALFVREWFAQNIKAPALPRLPAA